MSRNHLFTAAVVAVAALVVLLKYWDYVVNPWTRDGQVRAEVIQITPRVTGPIVRLAVKDNQFVKAGDLLFEIDPRTFAVSLDQARAQYDKTGDSYLAQEKQVEAVAAQIDVARGSVLQAQSAITEATATIAKNKAELQRQQELLPQRATSQKSVDSARANYEVVVEKRKGAVASLAQARATLIQAEADLAEAKANLGAPGEANASVREARANVQQAELNLEFTQVRAPVNGYITNLNLRLGSQAVANQPALALVDVNSYWIDGFFRENTIERMVAGDKAIITLMAYPDKPVEGYVDSLGWGIAQQDGSTGFELLPNISPTFEWIRLAQRVPVRIHMTKIPEGVALRVGTSCSVLVMTGTGQGGEDTPAPSALQ
ncbi:MAG: HlyD family secretion protein [Gammaproteobacteria bacterium]|nr:MAG: HlyD family secretion protein [Gammaproteobacteria bacterium]RLA12756.1 MAG: HlyD family secretion protein [Gammaproteobacteria bacterium]